MSTDLELLQRAEALIRERAGAATPGPWRSRRGPSEYILADGEIPTIVADVDTREDRRHIASWDPVVAIAVANLLGDAAWRFTVEQREWAALERWHITPNWVPTVNVAALHVARTYLKES